MLPPSLFDNFFASFKPGITQIGDSTAEYECNLGEKTTKIFLKIQYKKIAHL